MASAIEFCMTLMREAHAQAHKSFPLAPAGERYSYAWGHVMGQLMRYGAAPKAVLPLSCEPSGVPAKAMSAERIMSGLGRSINEVLLTTPTTMLDIEPEEAVEDMACRLVLEAVKHGLVIADRVSYDRLVTENRDLRELVARHPQA